MDSIETAHARLLAHVQKISQAPLTGPANDVAEELLVRFPGAALVFYGSGNSVNADQDSADILFDFYVIGKDYKSLYSSAWLRFLNKIIPPNVFYLEVPKQAETLRAKYAVLSVDDFQHLTSSKTFHSYFWARFAQPCRVIGHDPNLVLRVQNSLAQSIVTFCDRSAGLLPTMFTARQLWISGLGKSYKAELRAEDPGRAKKLVESYGDWAADVTMPALIAAGEDIDPAANGDLRKTGAESLMCALAWQLRSFQGIFLSVARLLKGTQTFTGGIEYIAWKIQRHSGLDLALTPWEKRHPLLAAPIVGVRYYRMKSQKRS